MKKRKVAKPKTLQSRPIKNFLDIPGTWFGVKTLYLYYRKKEGKWVPMMSEERVVLVQATCTSEAILAAEHEAESYAYTDKVSKVKYLGEGAVHVIDDAEIKHGCEIFSRFRAEGKNIKPDLVVARALGKKEKGDAVSTRKLKKYRR